MVVLVSVCDAKVNQHLAQEGRLGQRHAALAKIRRHRKTQPILAGAQRVMGQQQAIRVATISV